MFLQTYPEFVPEQGAQPYVPRIYGFRIFGQRGSKYELSKGVIPGMNFANTTGAGKTQDQVEEQKQDVIKK